MNYRRYVFYYTVFHIAAAVLVGGFFVLDYFGVFDKLLIYCPFHFFLHLYCPACGGTRAAWLLFSGDLLGSLVYNPTTIALAVSLIYYEVAAIRSLITRKLLYIKSVRFYPLYVTVGICLLYCVVRNVLLVNGVYDGIGELLPYWK